MPKKSISSLELAALVNELQFLLNGKVSHIYHPESNVLLLQLHAPGRGKQLLKIVSGKWLCLTQQKENALKPSSFCMQLRKYIDNAVIKNLYQQGSERVVIFELEKPDTFFLIIELFSKGNIILTDAKKVIITALENQEWKDRTVKPKEKYIFPPLEINWKELSVKRLQEILKKSEKRNLATSLATEIGLGGLYAEELCRQAGVNLEKKPAEVTAKEAELLVKTMKNFQMTITTPKGYIYENEVTPFPLLDKKALQEKKSYNEAIDSLKLSEKLSPYQNKIKTLQRTIAEQEEAIKNQEERIIIGTQKGERVYEKYQSLQKLKEIVEEMKKSKSWADIAKELKKERKISKINLEKKVITIDL
ncbi:MAG TPA: NFACT family protein [Candidatus Nanoarchaeia archaeon]|nr:NFACT family protein [Candidatus Nanoarchaeia archaeon]